MLKFRGHQESSDGILTPEYCRHSAARQRLTGFSAAWATMLEGWSRMATAHLAEFDSRIGRDGLLGPQWEAIGRAMKCLLNGSTGGLDAGSLNSNIGDCLEAHGCKRE